MNGPRSAGHRVSLVRILVGLGLGAAILLVPSCPPPFGDLTVLHLKDVIGPVITITSPAEGSSYGSTVIVSGTVTDSASPAGAAGKVKSLTYEITPATLPGGNVTVGEGGVFSFRFDTAGFSGPMVIRLVAEDWNGNQGEVKLNLVDGGAIPSFGAEPGSSQVTLRWDPVPLTAGYTLYYTTDGTLPSSTYGYRLDGVQSPFVLANLKNGSMHVFLLQAHAREGRDNWSTYCRAIPLSSRTLAPRVTGEFRKILVEWNAIPATDEFEVLRAESIDGPYLSISGGIRGDRFVDSMVVQGLSYFYKVRPNLPGAVESVAVVGKPGEWPTAPERRIGSFLTAGPALGLAVRNGYAFVACGDAGLAVVDVSDPFSPCLVRSVDVPGSAWNVALDERRALVPGADSGLHIFDITGPTTLEYRGSYTASTITGVATRGDIAYTTGSNLGVLDISDPSAPVLLRAHEHSGGWFPSPSADVVLSGNYAFAIYGTFEVADITDPANPIFDFGSAQGIQASSWMFQVPQRLSLLGKYAYVADGEYGIKIFDVSAPSTPILAGSLDTSGFAISTSASGSRAFVADGPSGVLSLDVSVPWTPTLVARIDTPDEAAGIVVDGEIAYVADGGSGLQVMDMRIPTPLSVGSFDAPDVIDAFAIVGDLAFVTYGEDVFGSTFGGLLILDLSVPSAPRVAGSCSLSTSAYGIAVSGSYALLGNSQQGLKVIDVSNPASPTVVATYCYSVPSYAWPVMVTGDLALVGFAGLGLVMFDISDPLQPRFLSSQNVGGITSGVRGIATSQGLVYATDTTAGLLVFDMSDPVSARRLAQVATPGSANAVAVSGKHAYVADGSAGLLVYDISAPSTPTLVGSYVPAGSGVDLRDVAVSGSYAFVSDATLGLLIIDVSDPASPFQAGQFPSSSTTLAISGRLALVSDGQTCHVLDLEAGR